MFPPIPLTPPPPESSPPSCPSDITPLAFYPSYSTSKVSLMIFTILPKFLCVWFPFLRLRDLWDQTGKAFSSFFFFLAVIFLEQLVWHAWISGEEAFPQCGTYIMILHVWEWGKSQSIIFRTFQDQVTNKMAQFDWIWHWHLLHICAGPVKLKPKT